MRHLKNPYGIDAPKGATIVKVGLGDRTHIYDASKGDALCSTKPNLGVVKSKATKVTCYRCIKLQMMNEGGVRQGGKDSLGIWNVIPAGMEDRLLRPSAADKRLLHMMIEGGRGGQFIGRREKPSRAKLKQGYRDAPGRFGPHVAEEFKWGGFEHPTQSVRSEGREVIPLVDKSSRRDAAGRFTGYRVANPAAKRAAGKRGATARKAGAMAVRKESKDFMNGYLIARDDLMSEPFKSQVFEKRAGSFPRLVGKGKYQSLAMKAAAAMGKSIKDADQFKEGVAVVWEEYSRYYNQPVMGFVSEPRLNGMRRNKRAGRR